MPRPERLVITADRLEAIWPEARIRLIRSLTTRGADEHTAEDIAQEVALRAMDRGLEFSDVDDFCRWGCTVAKNLYVDQARHRLRVVAMNEVPDEATGHQDVPDQVEHRLTLGRTLRGLAMLGESDRTAIVAGLSEPAEGNRKVANRSAVRRHRARVRLLRLVEGLAAFLGLTRGVRRTLQTAAVAAVVSGAAVLLPHVSPWSGGADAGTPRADAAAAPRRPAASAGSAGFAPRDADIVGRGSRAATAAPAAATGTSRPAPAAPGGGGGGREPVLLPVDRPRGAHVGNEETGGAYVEEYQPAERHLVCVGDPNLPGYTCVDPVTRVDGVEPEAVAR